jgi:hypothetical protein
MLAQQMQRSLVRLYLRRPAVLKPTQIGGMKEYEDFNSQTACGIRLTTTP